MKCLECKINNVKTEENFLCDDCREKLRLQNLHPVGIIPQGIWERHVKQERLLNIKAAIERYEMAELPIPNEWEHEYKYLKLELEILK